MSGTATWTPAPRGGLIPLQPLGFGTILGKSFAALRGNPKVLLGFAMVVQIVGSLIAIAGIAGVAVWSFSRLDTVEDPGDWEAIYAGSMLITGAATLVIGLGLGVLSVIVQGVVIGEVAHAALGERATLGMIWRRVRPAVWRLFGYAMLAFVAVAVAVFAVVAVIVGVGVAGGESSVGLVVALVLLAIAGGVAAMIFFPTKLFVVPSVIVLEGAGVFRAIGRSWSLTRGRFWATFGIIIVISLILNVAASIVGIPFQLIATLVGTTIAPTGDVTGSIAAMIVTVVLSQIVLFLIQAVAIVVQGTSSVLVYLDLRMRREGIDLRMQRYIERRDAGATALEDPYAYDPNAVAPYRPPAPTYAPAPGYPAPMGAPGGYGYGPYGQAPAAPPYGSPPYGQPTPQYGQPQYGQPQPPYGQSAPPYGQGTPPYGQPAPSYGSPGPTTAPPPPGPAPYAPPHPRAGAAYAPPAPAPGSPAPLAPFVLPPIPGAAPRDGSGDGAAGDSADGGSSPS